MALYLAVRDSRLEGMVIEGPVVRCPRCAEETREAVGLCRKCQVEYALCARHVIVQVLFALGAWLFFLLLVLSTVSVWR